MDYAKAHVAAGVLRVDEGGRIWRTKVISHGKWKDIEERRAENIGGKGYLRVSLHVQEINRLEIVMAHNLVYEVLVGPIPEGLELNHEDLNKTNNRPLNLKPMTGAQNIQHSYNNGRPHPWSKSTSTTWRGQPRISQETKAAICRMRASGAFYTDIAKQFGVSLSHTYRICMEGGTQGNGA